MVEFSKLPPHIKGKQMPKISNPPSMLPSQRLPAAGHPSATLQMLLHTPLSLSAVSPANPIPSFFTPLDPLDPQVRASSPHSRDLHDAVYGAYGSCCWVRATSCHCSFVCYREAKRVRGEQGFGMEIWRYPGKFWARYEG
jgi:hypothetical protein